MALTVRARKFARLVASGLFQTDALDIAYGKGTGTRKTRKEEASRLAAKPEVKAAIAEYEEQLMPIGDLRAVAIQMEANLQHLALHASSDRVRLQACQALIEICERREAKQRPARNVNVDRLIDELAELAPKHTPDLEPVDDKAEEATGR
jgi:hypothetical protein